MKSLDGQNLHLDESEVRLLNSIKRILIEIHILEILNIRIFFIWHMYFQTSQSLTNVLAPI